MWRPVAALLGLACYAGTIRYCAWVLLRAARDGDTLLLPYRRFLTVHLAAIMGFVIAGLCWARAPLAAAEQCFMTLGVADRKSVV